MTNDETIICRARQDVTGLMSLLANAGDDRRRVIMADLLLRWLLTTSSGYLSSDVLEKVYLELSNKIKIDLSPSFDSRTCLIVMSQAYISGGHTRWIEKWIDCERTRKYSLVFTRPVVNEIPGKLIQLICDRGGRVFCLGYGGREDNAMKLRSLASRFESVMLSPHMDDVIPLLAFGNVDFKRPIAFMNHANYMFWVGMSVADRIIDCGVWQQKIALSYRGADKTYNLPWMQYEKMPDLNFTSEAKIASRAKLALRENRFILLTAAPAYKYRPVNGLDFTEVISGVLERCENAEFQIVGMDPIERPDWMRLSQKYNNRISIHPPVPLDELKIYCTAADLYVDSFPFTSGGAVEAGWMCGCPALTICKDFDYPAWMKCADVPDMIRRIVEAIVSPSELSALRDETMTFLRERAEKSTRAYCQPILQGFMDELEMMPHSLRKFKPVIPEMSTNDFTILATHGNLFENRRLRHAILCLSIGPEWMGILIWHFYNRYVAARDRFHSYRMLIKRCFHL